MSTMYTLAPDQRCSHVNNVYSGTFTYVLLYQAVIKEAGGAHLYAQFRGPHRFIIKTKQSSNPLITAQNVVCIIVPLWLNTVKGTLL